VPFKEDDGPKSSRQVELSGRLESWKEIATYLKREVRTVQRWEKEEGLPIHRQMHKSLGTVYAYKSELDGWWNNGRHRFGVLEAEPVAPEPKAVAPVCPPAATATDPQDGVGGQRPPLQEVGGAFAGQVAVPPAAQRRLVLGLAVAGAIIVGASIFTYLAFHLPPPAPQITGYTQLTSDGQEKSSLFTDGSRLYFSEKPSAGARTLMSMPVTGGDPTPINIPFRNFGLKAISFGRSELLIGSTPAPGSQAEPLWTLPLAGGPPRRLGSLLADIATWSPDGERIAYSRNRELYLALADGTDSRKVSTLPGEIISLSWSPDGTKLRLYVDAPDREVAGFWDIAADGSGVHRILPNWEQYTGRGEWAPGASYFLFLSNFEFGGKRMLWAWPEHTGFLRRTVGTPIQLAPAGPLNVLDHTLSPDGKKIFVIGLQQRPELVRYDAALHEFVPFLGGIPAQWAAFSKDGKRTAYLRLPGQTLWRANADGSEPVQLTFAPLKGDGLAWSPDGKTIALRAQMPGQPWKVYLIPAEGGAPEPLTAGTQDEGVPTWSADSKEIVFGDVPTVFGQDDGHHALHLVNVKTRTESDLPGSNGLWTSRWSPDGRLIAAQTITSQYLRLFDFTKRKWRNLAEVQTDSPTWSRDGKYVYFDAPLSAEIYRVRIKDGAIEKIVGLGNIGGAPSWRCGLAYDDSPLVTREAGFTEIYALDWQAP
jgi:Tol biopolymer transport system component